MLRRIFVRLFDWVWIAVVIAMVMSLLLGILMMVANPFGGGPEVIYDKESGVCDNRACD